MATYAELYGLRNNSELVNKVTVAVVIAAVAIKDEDPSVAARVEWANRVLSNPTSMGKTVTYAVLALNKSATVAQINAANDASIQNNVDDVVDLLIGS